MNDPSRIVVPGIPDRFEILRQVGEGGMGVVYEAIDRHRGASVALKTLQKMEPVALYRFKHEFRSLAGLSHPNLVPLYELISESGTWFFTMEFVDGLDFIASLRTVRPGAPQEDGRSESATTTAPQPFQSFNMAALRSALRQLAEGVQALHSANIVHRDLKPSNVLVRGDGHLVILDFGIAKEISARSSPVSGVGGGPVRLPSDVTFSAWTSDRDIVGSVPYMAPEQASGGEVAAASDWYAVGVMLYEALTGRLPFLGDTWTILMKKQSEDPVAPRVLCPEVPEKLSSVCMALLRRNPAERFGHDDLLAQLFSGKRSRGLTVSRPAAFVGRQTQLATLAAAYEQLENDRAVTVRI